MERKYEFTEEVMSYEGRTLHRIRALRNFSDVKKGDLGGWIEKEENLSHEGDCWVGDNAKVYENAKVFGNARVHEGAQVYEFAKVRENAWVSGNAQVYGYARVYENARAFGNAEVYENARVFENARVCDNTVIYGNARVFGNARVYGGAEVYGNARVFGYAEVYGNAEVYGKSKIDSVANISSNSIIKSTHDFMIIGPIGSREDYTTFSKSASGINVVCGCFSDTIEEFEEKVKETHKGNRYESKYLDAVAFVKNQLD